MGTKNNEICWRLRFHFFVAYWEVLFKEVILFMLAQNQSLTSAPLPVCFYLRKNIYTLTELIAN